MKVISPLSGTENVEWETSISTAEIVKGYQQIYKVDVARFFIGIDTIDVYRCLDTGYRFFYPYSIGGDSKFYEELQRFDWYYMESKWEHDVCISMLNKGDKVLEVGCAKGSFVKRLTAAGLDATGLELNAWAAREGRMQGLQIFEEDVLGHAQKNEGKYDAVCSFQVMEHIAGIKEVLQASVKALKAGGKLFMSVPNNNSFLGLDKNFLNIPPHHMGLWDPKSLVSLEKILNIKVHSVHLEPLQSYHKDYFYRTLINYSIRKWKPFSGIIRRVGPRIIPAVTCLLSKEFKAYTVQVVFEKK